MWSVLILAPLFGCIDRSGGPPADTAPIPVCEPMANGRYLATGVPFGMPMDVDLAFDEATCSFIASNWTAPGGSSPMNHADMMLGGQLDGADVTLHGTTSGWDTCEGLLEGGNHLHGTCSRGAFDLTRK